MSKHYGIIPQITMDALDRYVHQGIPTGGFLYAVLTNDLFEAMGRADQNNRAVLFEICQYIYNLVPSGAWGTPEKVKAWSDTFKTKT